MAFYVKPKGASGVIAANILVFFTRPFRYLRAFAYSLRLTGLNARSALLNLAYLAEAAVIADWMRRQDLTHYTCIFHFHGWAAGRSSRAAAFIRQPSMVRMNLRIRGVSIWRKRSAPSTCCAPSANMAAANDAVSQTKPSGPSSVSRV